MSLSKSQKLIHRTKFQKFEETETSKIPTKNLKNTRICVLIEEDVNKKLRLLQGGLISKNQQTVSLSQTINHALRKNLEKNYG